MTDILDEANEDYKYTKKVETFRKSLPYIAILTFLAVIILSIISYRSSMQNDLLSSRTDLFIKTIESDSDKDLKDKIFLELSTKSDPIGIISNIKIARANLETNFSYSSEIYESIIKSDKTSILIKNFVKIEYSNILISLSKISQENFLKASSYLISIKKNEPFYEDSIYNLALLNLSQNNKEKAFKYLQELKSIDNLSEFLKNQINIIEFNLNK